jgi:hypothetical protein
MALSGRMAKRLATGPTLLLTAEVSDEIADALVAYDPALRVRSDRFAFGNGVLLHGPVDVTAELAAKAGLPASTASAYYGDIIETGTRGSRPDQAKWQDAERLVRGLADLARGIGRSGPRHAGRSWPEKSAEPGQSSPCRPGSA